MRFVCHIFLCALAATALASCADRITAPNYPPPSAPVRKFIHAEGLPLLRTAERVLQYEETEFFRVHYGRPQDCPSGCFYSAAIGVRLGAKIGWLGFLDLDGHEPDTTRFFELTPADSALCRAELWGRMQVDRDPHGVLWFSLLPVVARDPDSPRDALLRLARMLRSYIAPHVADRLLENPVVRHDIPILTELSTLPVFQGDAYAEVRRRAGELLDELRPAHSGAGL